MNEAIMKQAGFGKHIEMTKEGKCPFCKRLVNAFEFKDSLSRKEYYISGLCQICQDDFFN